LKTGPISLIYCGASGFHDEADVGFLEESVNDAIQFHLRVEVVAALDVAVGDALAGLGGQRAALAFLVLLAGANGDDDALGVLLAGDDFYERRTACARPA
jgi:hypothetical protein